MGAALMALASTHAPKRATVHATGTGNAIFEANGGRTDRRVAFVSHHGRSTLWVTKSGPVLAVRSGRRRAVVSTTFVGARGSEPAGRGKLRGVVNSIVGSDRRDWRTGIATFGTVEQRSLYPGIDLTYHAARGPLEYDFVVGPGADPGAIALRLDGAQRVRLGADGDLVIDTPNGRLRQPRPVAWQGARDVPVSYVVAGNRVRLHIGAYDRSRPLVIDPELAYSRRLAGGSNYDTANAIAVDADGNAYVAGSTDSSDFPTANAYDSSYGGAGDAFVVKLSADGQTRLYTTYIGGTGGDQARAIAVDSSGRAVVGGDTYSTTGFPPTTDFGPRGSDDVFVVRLAASGSAIDWAGRLGGTGSDYGYGLALDSSGNIFVAGSTSSATTSSSTAYPRVNAYSSTFGGSQDAFLTVIQQDGSALLYSSYFGGSSFDRAYGVAVDPNGKAYLGGSTGGNWPVKNQWSLGGPTNGSTSQGSDAFIAKVDPAQTGANSLVYSSYYGGAGQDYGLAVAVNSAGEAYLTGNTDSFNPAQPNPQTFPVSSPITGHLNNAGGVDAFVAKFRDDGDLLVSTFLGGAGDDGELAVSPMGIAVDAQGNVVVAGSTASTSSSFPVVRPVQAENNGGDIFITKIKPTNPQPVFSTFLGGGGGESAGGLALDSHGGVYLAGGTGSSDFPLVGPSADPTANNDTIAVKIQSPRAATVDSGPSGPIGTNTATYTFSLPSTETQSSFQCRVDSASFTACTSPYTTPALSEGAHTVDIRPLDFGGTPGATIGRSITVDTSGPSTPDLQSPADGATTGAAPEFAWSSSSDSATGVAGYALMVDGGKVAERGGDCAGTCTLVPPPIPDGAHQWRVDARDGAGNTTSSASRAITIAEPPVASFTAAPNPALVGRVVTFDGSASSDNSQVTRWEWDLDGDGNFETNTGAVPTATRTYPAKAGVKVGLRVSDASGLTGTTERTVTINAVPGKQAEFGVSINKGAQFTNDPNVKLALEFPLSTTSVLVSNDGGFKEAKSLLPADEVKWKLDSSGPERLPKTVYVRYQPNLIAGLTFTDDIILDETPPTIVSASLAAPAGASTAARAAAARKWSVRVKAKDRTSGVGFVQTAVNKRKPGKLVRYGKKVKVKSAARPKWIRVRDRAKNYSRWRKLR